MIPTFFSHMENSSIYRLLFWELMEMLLVSHLRHPKKQLLVTAEAPNTKFLHPLLPLCGRQPVQPRPVITGISYVRKNRPHRCYVQIRPGVNSTNAYTCTYGLAWHGTDPLKHGPLKHNLNCGPCHADKWVEPSAHGTVHK